MYLQFMDESKPHQRRKNHHLNLLMTYIARYQEKFGHDPEHVLCGPTTAQALAGAPIDVRHQVWINANLMYVGSNDP